ncbi:MAG: hypothetical protein AAFV90_24700 [Cyanobacteria bacterium J06634_5]
MTMTSSSIQVEDQLALRIEKEVRQQMDSILENIHKLSTEYKIADEKEKSPFRNVLAVAVESSSSLEIIKNYIRYQVGRSGGSRIWSSRGGPEQKLFAQELVNALDNLSKDVGQIFSRINASLSKLSSEDLSESPEPSSECQTLLTYLGDENNQKVLKRSLHLELAQLYLGYLAREHTAQVGEKEANKGANSSSSKNNQSEQKRQSPPGKPKLSKKQGRR